MNSKKLHKHALPVVLAGFAGFIAAAGIAGIINGSKSGNFTAALTTRAFSVRATSGVTAKVAPAHATQATATDEATAVSNATTIYFALNNPN